MSRKPITRTPFGEKQQAYQPLWYFGEADLQIPGLLGPSDSLLTTLTRDVLYHGDLAVTDIFLFGNPTLITAFLPEKSTFRFLSRAISHGALLPWFRDDTGGSFERGLRDIWDSGVIGTDRENALAIARQLDTSLESDKAVAAIPYTYGIWPRDELVGGRLLQQVENRLGANRATPSGFERVWEDTETMRVDWIRESVERVDDRTLRRGDLLTVIDEKLGCPQRGEVRNVGELLERINDPVDRERVTTFLWWITHLYQENQADLFGLAADLRIGHKAQLLVVAGDEEPALPVGADVRHFRIPVPRPYVLWGASDEIFKLRNSWVGQDYFAALAEWRLDPNPSSATRVEKQLRQYSGRLLGLCEGGAIEYLCGTLGTQKLSTRQIKGAIGLLIVTGGILYPSFGMAIGALEVALGLWQVIHHDSAERAKQWPIAKWTDLDVIPEGNTIRYLHEPVTSQGKSS